MALRFLIGLLACLLTGKGIGALFSGSFPPMDLSTKVKSFWNRRKGLCKRESPRLLLIKLSDLTSIFTPPVSLCLTARRLNCVVVRKMMKNKTNLFIEL